ncbi:MAG: penicillin-binding protein 2 [bacterium]|nr:penicillin-binding protein 2 [bacterium]
MSRWRITFILVLLCLFGAAALVRLGFLQIVSSGFYKALAQGQQQVSSLAKGERGQILSQDKKGNLYPLASNKRISSVFLSPPEIEDKDLAIRILSDILSVSKDVLSEKVSERESLYELIAKDITQEQVDAIEEHHLAGVYVGQDVVRSYPQGAFASRILGFTNQDGQGQYGIEENFNATLEGKEGIDQSAQNPGGYLFLSPESQVADGKDVVLTIDYNIQSQAESLLGKKAESLEYDEGTIVVADPISGKILALAVYPNFDPNSYGKVGDLSLFQNPAVQSLFEPGSIFKPITMASAIDKGKVTPETEYVDKGILHVGTQFITNYDQRTYGKRTMTEVLEFSINTGAVFAEEQLGSENFLQYIKKFGILEPTHIDLPGEVYSENREFQKGYAINFMKAAFGQGIEMNPLQILRAFFTFTNKGIRVDPYIMQGVADEENIPREENRVQVVSADTASKITSMLVKVVEDGFGKRARIPGYYIAGKTGTAQIPWSALGISKSGYSDKTIQSFIGYAPAYDPKFIILVSLKNPNTGTAEYSAIPMFHDLAKYIIDYYQIPPDHKE